MYALQLLRLATADLRRDWALCVCQVFSLAAALTPLLVLVGLQQGVIGGMLDGLRQNAAMRVITPRVTGGNRFSEDFLAALRHRADVAFVVGDIRPLASGVMATLVRDPGSEEILLTMVPTAPDDPLRSGDAWAAGRMVVLSAAAARSLHAQAGDALSVIVPRKRDGAEEAQRLSVTVASVIPESRLLDDRKSVLAEAALVQQVQLYRDGFAVPERGWPGKPQEGAHTYERFRLYARSIDDVEGLVAWLRDQGVEPSSELGAIAPVAAVDHGLSIVLLIIGSFAAGGFVVATGTEQWSGVQRKRRELGLLGLLGYGRLTLLALPLLEALLLAALGTVVAGLLYAAAAEVIDLVFAPVPGVRGAACRLAMARFVEIASATVALAVIASLFAAWQVTRIEPAHAIRDN